ncbi:MAG: phosphoribosylanthranilate isomerase [Bacteroidetes bacterium]|nr:MAG: phosphoribosylanthranilate isomerase [Bacteroidota bacterium]RLD68562.1 MAG: phosphoribosylanthranilate isomerase [Bacteroidota bacterium]RLD84698.1 MAG: phosphoribosylanthranilate isomerase [Bacteroidota bacterium]HHL57957.1 phosphoribosylanthranilate isomerase [Bacteroidota bacterium]
MNIKVCGIADPEFLRRTDELSIDFAGFIFYPRSQRFIGDRITADQINAVPGHMKRVGVFVNEKPEVILSQAKKYSLDMIQLHGDEDSMFAEQLAEKIKVIKAFRVDEGFNFSETKPYEKSCSFFLFDTKGKLYGGTGKKFNWDLLQKYTGHTPFLLSGGITPEDAGNIRKFSHPALAGVDLNSGFETAAGVKDIQKIKNFLKHIL